MLTTVGYSLPEGVSPPKICRIPLKKEVQAV